MEDSIGRSVECLVWMLFLYEFNNAGGRVTTGSDSGFIYKIFGFGYIVELELLVIIFDKVFVSTLY